MINQIVVSFCVMTSLGPGYLLVCWSSTGLCSFICDSVWD